ncbi:MAG TPA: glucose-6-phosphate dehydrogenase, partial [Blastocatellia bacterium]
MDEPKLPKADSCLLVIFGASGDLTKRKLLPALYTLNLAGSLSSDFRILGVGQDQMTDGQFRDSMRDGVVQQKETPFSDEKWKQFQERLFYMRGDLKDQGTYNAIAERLAGFAKQGAKPNHLFYFSTPPTLAPSIVQGLGASGLAKEEAGWSRIVVEKPFGRDLQSAVQLNREIAKIFDEKQVYRIDHYLGKETVQNLLVFRFGNYLFEPIWTRHFIDYVEITAAETLGVENRAGYYEEAGALRDMVANHMAQLLTLTAMEPPVAYDAESVREQKVQVLRSIHPMTEKQVAIRTVRGQYGPGVVGNSKVAGYRQEKGVSPESVTETFAALRIDILNWRWADVPFYLRTGKRLANPVTE